MSSSEPTKHRIRWAPQAGPQHALIRCPIREIFFGGARGGGKTDGIVGRVGLRAQYFGRHYNAIIFRREMPQADDLIERADDVWGPLGRLNRSTSTFRFQNGSRVRFRPLERVSDAAKYQGQNVVDAIVEEAGNYPSPDPILRLFGVLRSAHRIPTSMLLTGNPGGPGQQWIKERYAITSPDAGLVPIVQQLPDGSSATRIFIPSRVRDNRILLASDPHYIANLHLVGSDALVRAWLDGDFNAIEGAFFDCWETVKHVCAPFDPPKSGLRFRSIDWGSARPFSVGWWWSPSDDFRHPGDNRLIPRGALVRYREWYGCVKDKPNTGLKLTAEKVAEGIAERTPEDERKLIAYTVADPAMFSEDGGPSLAERMMTAKDSFGRSHGVVLRPADNARVSKGRGHLGGWDMMRQRLLGEAETPMIVCFNTCRDSIRTIPTLQHDETHAEDIDTESEDHAADEWRYACMSRPWRRVDPLEGDPLDAMKKRKTFDEVLAEHDRELSKRKRL